MLDRPGGGQDDRSAPEQCNLIDDDCDGEIDEDFDLLADVENCGTCGRVCDLDGASAACVAGECEIVQCRGGRFDLDAEPATGCEYACVPSASPDELCDHRDNDCDGEVDEAWPIGEFCVSTGECGAGALECDDTGMDVQCDSAPGSSRERNLPERCNGLDDDCNGEVDNDVSAGLVATDPRNCGACGATCPQRPSATAVCTEGECDFVCLPGNLDGDRLAANGCEIACGPPQVVRLEGGNSAAIRAGLAQAGQCGVLELSGAFDLDDALPIVLSEPGTTLRAGPAGAILTLSVPARVPVFEITGPGTTLRGLQMEMAGVPRAAIRAVNTGALTLADLVIREGRLGCGADETGQHALIDLESVEGAAVTNLTATGVTFAEVVGAVPLQCAGEDLSLIQAITSHRLSIRDATLGLGFMNRIAGQGSIVNFRWTNDSEIVGATITFSSAIGVNAAAAPVPSRSISLYESNRNLIERNTLVGGEGGPAGAVGLYLSGSRNRAQFNTFGVAGRRACLVLAVDVRDTNNTLVDNTFYGGRFLMQGEPGPAEVIGFVTTLPQPPTNLGAVVIANARSPVVQGVSVHYDPDALGRCDALNDNRDGLPGAYEAGIHIIDSTDIHVESNLVGEMTGPPSFTPTCGRAGMIIQRARGGEVVGNTVAGSRPGDAGQGCDGAGYLQASLGVVGGSDLRVESNTLTTRNFANEVAPGSIIVTGGTRVRIGSQTVATLVFNGPEGLLEDLEVLEQTEFYSTGGTVRRLRMTGAGNQFFNALAYVAGDGMLFEDSVIGRPDCIPQAYYALNFAGDHATMRNVDAYCQRGSPILTLPPNQAGAMTVENSLFDIRGDRTAIYLRGYGQFTFDGVTFAHTGARSDPLFLSEAFQPMVIRNSIISDFPQILRYIGPALCCGRQLDFRASYTDFWQVTDLQPALVQMGVGNLFEDPRFRAAATFDFRLAPGSPAIDAADPALPVGAEPVPNGGRRDLGAYGGTSRATASGP